MIVTVTEFNVYSGNMETATSVASMKEDLLLTAETIVKNYLGFDPESADHEDYLSGIGTNRLYLFAHPITEVDQVVVNGIELAATDYTIKDGYLRLNNGVWPVGIENVLVDYTAGWSSENMPDLIKTTILQIATLLLEESGGNIGVTSKSFSDNSRTFIQYTNFEKWLRKLDPYRIVRLT